MESWLCSGTLGKTQAAYFSHSLLSYWKSNLYLISLKYSPRCQLLPMVIITTLKLEHEEIFPQKIIFK